MPDLALSRGQNTALSGPRPLTVEVRSRIRVDVLAFVLRDNEKVSGDADFVFYNQPVHPSGAVTLDDQGIVVVDPSRLPEDASRVHIGVVAEHRTLGDAGIEVVLSQDGRTVTAPGEGLSIETSAVLIEVYRRGDDWKVRNTSAGWEGGFADLVRSHGVQVDDEPVPGESGAAGPRVAPGEEGYSPRPSVSSSHVSIAVAA